MSRGHRALRTAAVCLALMGGAPAAQASYIHAKAILAQVLIKSAWNKSKAEASRFRARTERVMRPWPWADTYPVARLRAPGHGVDLVVLAGASGRTLAFGPGHVAGTAEPGASFGNVAIGGHRDTHFRFLKDVKAGDLLRLETEDGSETTYVVERTRVVDQSDASVLGDLGDGAEPVRLLTLVTCYPFDAISPGGPLRYVVMARESPHAGSHRPVSGTLRARAEGRVP